VVNLLSLAISSALEEVRAGRGVTGCEGGLPDNLSFRACTRAVEALCLPILTVDLVSVLDGVLELAERALFVTLRAIFTSLFVAANCYALLRGLKTIVALEDLVNLVLEAIEELVED